MPTLLMQPEHEPAIEELLLSDPVQNIFLLGMLEQQLNQAYWYGVTEGDHVLGVALVLGGLMVPFAPDPAVARELGAHLRGRHSPDLVVGPREASDSVLSRWTDTEPATWLNQRLYRLGTPLDGPAPDGFQRARPQHLEAVARLSIDMQLEDLGRAPRNMEVHVAATRDRIEAGRSWIVEEDGEVVFTIHTSRPNPFGSQLGGTYVPPAHRGRGLATRGTAALCRELLKTQRAVTLHVNEANTPAIRAYERAGFVSDAPYRLAIMEAG